jgi:hypothetical protein
LQPVARDLGDHGYPRCPQRGIGLSDFPIGQPPHGLGAAEQAQFPSCVEAGDEE